jgi:hypothetical protein
LPHRPGLPQRRWISDASVCPPGAPRNGDERDGNAWACNGGGWQQMHLLFSAAATAGAGHKCRTSFFLVAAMTGAARRGGGRFFLHQGRSKTNLRMRTGTELRIPGLLDLIENLYE